MINQILLLAYYFIIFQKEKYSIVPPNYNPVNWIKYQYLYKNTNKFFTCAESIFVQQLNNNKQVKMTRILVFILFFFVNLAYVVIQSDSTDIIINPNPRRFATINNHTTSPGIKMIKNAPQAKWIWDANFNRNGCNQSIVIQKNFTVPCKSDSKLYVSANGPFQVQINGNVYMSGNHSGTLFYVEVQFRHLKLIQRNTLTIITSTKGDCNATNQAGVIYALVQHTEGCFVCPENQFWDSKYKVCRCVRVGQCLSPRQWVDQPICRCMCVQDIQCDISQYYDHSTCNCVCLPRLCPNNLALNNSTCEC